MGIPTSTICTGPLGHVATCGATVRIYVAFGPVRGLAVSVSPSPSRPDLPIQLPSGLLEVPGAWPAQWRRRGRAWRQL
eukprot:355536-Chlamydomonas_euryale.AAC.5